MNQGPAPLPHDVYGLVAYQTPIWLIVLSALAGLLVAALMFFLLKRYLRNRKDLVPQEKPRDFYIEAIRDLRGVEIETPFHHKAQIQFYFLISIGFRTYLERFLNKPTTDMTTDELKKAIDHKLPLSQEQYDKVWSVLEKSDLVKFAKQEVTKDQAEQDHHNLISIVEFLENVRKTQLEHSEKAKVASNMGAAYEV